jgi:sugar O-acyltransferase (sialic acid O-acetyltransferase NeuD family)
VPLVNTNEPESTVVEVSVQPGQKIAPGDLICVLETTKAVIDVASEVEGFIRDLRIAVGQVVNAGDLICLIGPEPVTEAEVSALTPLQTTHEVMEIPEGLRITKPAQQLAQSLGIDLNLLPVNTLVTEAVIRSFVKPQPAMSLPLIRSVRVTPQFDSTTVVVYGGGGHARTLIDLVRQMQHFNLIGIIDDGLKAGEQIAGLSVLGDRTRLPAVYEQGVRLAINGVGTVTSLKIRLDIYDLLCRHGFVLPSLVHRQAVVEPTAHIEAGSQVLALAYIGSDAKIGQGAIINTGAIVSHDCIIADHVHITPGAILAGGVEVGEGSLIGMGVTTAIGIHIGSEVQIGNGARVHADVPSGTVIRAGTTWPSY